MNTIYHFERLSVYAVKHSLMLGGNVCQRAIWRKHHVCQVNTDRNWNPFDDLVFQRINDYHFVRLFAPLFPFAMGARVRNQRGVILMFACVGGYPYAFHIRRNLNIMRRKHHATSPVLNGKVNRGYNPAGCSIKGNYLSFALDSHVHFLLRLFQIHVSVEKTGGKNNCEEQEKKIKFPHKNGFYL